MLAAKGNIIVRVNLFQKDEAVIGGNKIKTGKNYNENFRERNPVVAEVVDGLGEIKTGKWIVCNYNYFEWASPLQLTDDLFSVPFDEEIFAIINDDGSLKPVCGNLLVERMTRDSALPLPDELKKPYTDRGIVLSNAEGYYKNDFVLWLKMADYEIVYNWNDEERRAIKVHKSEIVGIFKK